jgi:hypothetical protein
VLAGDQAFLFVDQTAFSGTAAEIRWYQDGTDTWVAGDRGDGGDPELLVRLSGLHALTAQDFLL